MYIVYYSDLPSLSVPVGFLPGMDRGTAGAVAFCDPPATLDLFFSLFPSFSPIEFLRMKPNMPDPRASFLILSSYENNNNTVTIHKYMCNISPQKI